MKDLTTLANSGEIVEYLEHAKDIKPANRGTLWSKTTLKVAYDYLDYLRQIKPSAKDLALYNKIKYWSVFKKDDVFWLKSKELNLTNLKKCNNNCPYELNWILTRDKTSDFAHILLTQNKPFINKKSNLLMARIFADETCSFYVKNDYVRRHLLSFLSKYDYKNCKKELEKLTMQNFLSSKNKSIWKPYLSKFSNRKENIHLVKMIEILDNEAKTSASFVGNWEELIKISKDSKLRQSLMSKLFSLRPLAGKILYGKDKKSNKMLMAIDRYFPEYFPKYANECLKYFKNEIKAPSADCHQLFKKSKSSSLLSASKISEYEQIINSI
ncbi:MAG: hypothetical protein N4A33_05090 [Bacteriovoracaceae bacterium]|jgi:hypothetical protein|nr:hypothetical protein [Bacteriovoracaceae bacterium]